MLCRFGSQSPSENWTVLNPIVKLLYLKATLLSVARTQVRFSLRILRELTSGSQVERFALLIARLRVQASPRVVLMKLSLLLANADESMSYLLLQQCLNKGFEVSTASDGLSCVTHLRWHLPDVLVLDQDLAWGGCAGVLSWMRDDADAARVPVILLCDLPIRLAGPDQQTPVAYCLQKPYRISPPFRLHRRGGVNVRTQLPMARHGIQLRAAGSIIDGRLI